MLNAFTALQEQDLFHGRLRPENILLIDDGRIVLCDVFPNTFKYMARTYQNRTTGSLLYQAPEWNSVKLDKKRFKLKNLIKADVFSLGLILLECATLDALTNLNIKSSKSTAMLYSLVNSTAHLYGTDFRNLLFLMLNYDYKVRIDFAHALEFA